MMKGAINLLTIQVFKVIKVLMFLTLSFNMAQSVDDKVRMETTQIVSERIESTVYAISKSDSETRVQMNLSDTYGIQKRGGQYMLNYTQGTILLSAMEKFGRSRINPPVEWDPELGKGKLLCLIPAGSEVEVKLGGCN